MAKIYKKLMLKKMKKHIEEYYNNYQYSLCMSSLFINDFHNTQNFTGAYKLLNTCIKCDEKLPVPISVGYDLEELVDSEDLVIGIYRTFFDNQTLRSAKVHRIISNGIQIGKDVTAIPELSEKLYFPDNIIDFMQKLKEETKEPKVDFILTFPKKIISKNGNFDNNFNNLCNVLYDGIYIKPCFISSYVVSSQGILSKINIRDVKKILIKKPTD